VAPQYDKNAKAEDRTLEFQQGWEAGGVQKGSC
jgi:hypothetical protein